MRDAALRLGILAVVFGLGLGIMAGSGSSWPEALAVSFAIAAWVAVFRFRPRRRR